MLHALHLNRYGAVTMEAQGPSEAWANAPFFLWNCGAVVLVATFQTRCQYCINIISQIEKVTLWPQYVWHMCYT